MAPGNVLHLEPDHFLCHEKGWRVAQHYVGDLRAINNNVLDTTIPNYDPDEVMVGFTAATGGLTDEHRVDNFIVDCQ